MINDIQKVVAERSLRMEGALTLSCPSFLFFFFGESRLRFWQKGTITLVIDFCIKLVNKS